MCICGLKMFYLFDHAALQRKPILKPASPVELISGYVNQYGDFYSTLDTALTLGERHENLKPCTRPVDRLNSPAKSPG